MPKKKDCQLGLSEQNRRNLNKSDLENAERERHDKNIKSS